MKKFIVAILLIMVAPLCSAQAWLDPSKCVVSSTPLYPVPTTATKPAVLPSPKGAGTVPIVEVNDAGVAVAWWKNPTKTTPPVLYLYAVRWDAITPGLATDLLGIALASSPTAAIQSTTLKHQTEHILDMCDVWGPAAARITAAKPQL
jgi:hypothetical protein